MEWLEAVLALVTVVSAIYFPWKQNKIFSRQNDIFAAQVAGGAVPPPIPNSLLLLIKRYWPMITMALLVLGMWGAVGFDMYDRHHDRDPKGDQEIIRQAIEAWGPAVDGYGKAVLNGHSYTAYRGTHRFAVVCFHNSGVIDHKDIELSKGGLYDIEDGEETLLVKFSDRFVSEMKDGIAGTNYAILLVPMSVSMDQFGTLRQAETLGVKTLGFGFGPP